MNLLTRDEMWDVARRLRPDLDREAFDAMWDGFMAEKARRALH